MQHFTLQQMVANALPIDAAHGLLGGAGLQSTHQRSELEVVLDRAGVGILHRDLQRRVLLVNEAYCSLVDRSPEALQGTHSADLTHPDDVERSEAIYRAHVATGEPFHIEKRYLRSDGTAVWCSAHVSFVLDPEGKPQSTITIASDITARRLAEQELRESEEHYRHTVELSPQITWTAAPDGSVLEVSSR